MSAPDRAVRLSVLDHTPVSGGGPLGEAFAHSTALAQRAEQLGYHRVWVAEHHGRAWMAGSSPAILMAHLAASTSTIRIGSGALLLGNYSPLSVAEQFGMLEAMHPGRIDLGIGRSSGSVPVAAHSLNAHRGEWLDILGQLMAFFGQSWPEQHPYADILAVPGAGTTPAIHLLGSGTYSAELAGGLGLPFAHGGHFAAQNTDTALAAYRNAFRPSAILDRPYALLSVGVVAAPTDEEAHAMNDLAARNMIAALSGANVPFRGEGELDAATPPRLGGEAAEVRGILGTHIVGSPDTVGAGLRALAERTGVDELLVTTIVYDYAKRLRSYELVAAAMRSCPPSPSVS